MRPGVIEVGPQRYREAYGRYFEQFTVGDVYEHRPGRTITEADNIWFTLLTMNTHPSHFDHVYAAKTEFKRPLVNSPLTVAILVGMSVSDVSQKAVANLGWKEIRMTAPVFAGDTLYAESEVIEKRESAIAARTGAGDDQDRRAQSGRYRGLRFPAHDADLETGLWPRRRVIGDE